jgi:hypothetical protein
VGREQEVWHQNDAANCAEKRRAVIKAERAEHTQVRTYPDELYSSLVEHIAIYIFCFSETQQLLMLFNVRNLLCDDV